MIEELTAKLQADNPDIIVPAPRKMRGGVYRWKPSRRSENYLIVWPESDCFSYRVINDNKDVEEGYFCNDIEYFSEAFREIYLSWRFFDWGKVDWSLSNSQLVKKYAERNPSRQTFHNRRPKKEG